MTLQDIVNDQDLVKDFAFHTNVHILRRKLQAHPTVQACVEAWKRRDLTEPDVDAFLNDVLASYTPGVYFYGEYILCAIIVIAHEVRDVYMEELLCELHRLPAHEMPLTKELLEVLHDRPIQSRQEEA